nr:MULTISPECIES: PaaX family transcriptional regulator C-terminal domain-containing protein [unclassified Mycolicibacterium]
MLTLFALLVLGHPNREFVPTSLAVDVLEELGVAENATRTTLSRMVKRGFLVRQRRGRVAWFGLTEQGRRLLSRGRARGFRPTPFDHEDQEWTLLNANSSVVTAKNRYLFQSRLSWAGFAALDTRLWIAPGRVDVADLLGDLLPREGIARLNALRGVLEPPSRAVAITQTLWNLADIRSTHEQFLTTWERYPIPKKRVLAVFVHLGSDWSELLRVDPGLPASGLDADWPAARSTRTFRRLFDGLERAADAEFEMLVRGHGEI